MEPCHCYNLPFKDQKSPGCGKLYNNTCPSISCAHHILFLLDQTSRYFGSCYWKRKICERRLDQAWRSGHRLWNQLNCRYEPFLFFFSIKQSLTTTNILFLLIIFVRNHLFMDYKTLLKVIDYHIALIM